jgi:hypothetical protein
VGRTPAEAVVIYGSWRSGTTVLLEKLTELTGGKSVFEPLHKRALPRRVQTRSLAIPIPQDPDYREYCPYIPMYLEDHDLDRFLRRTLQGRVGNSWTRQGARFQPPWARPVLAKFVRGNLAAAYIHRRFGTRSIFLVRHPCAVVESILRYEGFSQIFAHREYLDHLLGQEALLRDYPQVTATLRTRSPMNLAQIVAANWALMHLVPLQQLPEADERLYRVVYEALVLSPDRELGRLLDFLGLSPEGLNLSLRRDSGTTEADRRNARAQVRCFGWRQRLTPMQVEEILDICRLFGDEVMALISVIEAVEQSCS